MIDKPWHLRNLLAFTQQTPFGCGGGEDIEAAQKFKMQDSRDVTGFQGL